MSRSLPVRERASTLGIDLARLPQHVAIIMDGNGRWASGQGLARLKGHHQGYLALRDVLRIAGDLGIGWLTVYGFSAENWRRPEEEVGGLMKLIHEAARKELRHLHQENVRVKVSGRISELPDFLRESLLDLVETTKDNTGITFVLAINYGGRAEIVDAVTSLLRAKTPPEAVTEELITQHLYVPEAPEPDLMIRTAGEMRWSNFLIWQAAYAELYVTDVAWPEFGEEQLLDGVRQYQARNRKFGGLQPDQA